MATKRWHMAALWLHIWAGRAAFCEQFVMFFQYYSFSYVLLPKTPKPHENFLQIQLS
jgi:hypothetical protein